MIYELMIPQYMLLEKKQKILQQYHEIDVKTENPELIQIYVEMILSDDIVKQHFGILAIRKLISANQNQQEIIQAILDFNMIPILIQILEQYSNQLFIYEAIWILANIASGTNLQTQVIVKNGVIPNLLKHLDSENLFIVEQVFWALGNIAADDAEFRNDIIQQGGLNQLIVISEKLIQENKIHLLKLSSWTIGNLSRGILNQQKIKKCKRQIINYFTYIIDKFDEDDTLTDTCWALVYISNPNSGLDSIQEIINTGIVPRLVNLLKRNQTNSITQGCLKIIRNLLTGSESQLDYILNQDILIIFGDLLSKLQLKSLIFEVCQCITNITAGNHNQLKKVIDNDIIMNLLLSIFIITTPEIQIQIACVYSNMLRKIKQYDILRLVDKGVLMIFGQTLRLQRTSDLQKIEILKQLDCIFKNASFEQDYIKILIMDFFKILDNLDVQINDGEEDENYINCESIYFEEWKNFIKN
ncbi:unnamed protein product [Paramecium sonneborni]|uniref:Importin subunit alpha n=1 Tax=Paramecium sonneborni TaxID=65129 RepID=A0A8S1MJE4_9CILI|nr:unnamed protein product [Paramecium sonneborni]